MITDTFNIIKMFKTNNCQMDVENLTNQIIDTFQNELLTKRDVTLLNLVFTENPKQEDLDNCLKSYDIEAAGGHKALMLAYFMKMHPDLKYSDYVAPRLKGLLQFYRFQNMKLISHYTKICRKLEESKVKFLIFKGGCMKHLRPDFPRVMGDIDILVLQKDYKKATQIAKKMGYDISYSIHAADLHPKGSEEGIMDIHKYIVMDSPKEKDFIKDFFKRAALQKIFGVETLVPCYEDLVFITLINMVRNLKNNSSCAGIPYTLFDCNFLINSKPDFDWNIVIKNAKKTGTENHIYFAIQFINRIVPNLLPEKIKLNNYFEKEFKKYCILLVYQRFFLWNMKQKSHEMNIKDLFTSWEFFKKYIKLKPKYFILKRSIIRKNANIAEKILKHAGMFI